MLAVTAYPMLNALWLSLFSYRLTDPAAREFVGLRNYGVVLSDALWWQTVVHHGDHHGRSPWRWSW